MKKEIEIPPQLSALREFTAARIAIGRVGNSIPLQQSMAFKLAHAHARDAVYSALDIDGLLERLKVFEVPLLHIHSQAANRQKYLKRPDLGRLLSDDCKEQLTGHLANPDIAIIIADGLSAEAVNGNAYSLLKILIPKLIDAKLTIGAICLVEQARVAIGDDIASGLNAKFSILLIGERPGLSSADSMGAYLTYNPKPGLTDESRNCISNIRKHGLSYTHAAEKIFYLVNESFRLKLSGVGLKDNAGLLE
jgi:ethanolamine ammonia-lyase small subunit